MIIKGAKIISDITFNSVDGLHLNLQGDQNLTLYSSGTVSSLFSTEGSDFLYTANAGVAPTLLEGFVTKWADGGVYKRMNLPLAIFPRNWNFLHSGVPFGAYFLARANAEVGDQYSQGILHTYAASASGIGCQINMNQGNNSWRIRVNDEGTETSTTITAIPAVHNQWIVVGFRYLGISESNPRMRASWITQGNTGVANVNSTIDVGDKNHDINELFRGGAWNANATELARRLLLGRIVLYDWTGKSPAFVNNAHDQVMNLMAADIDRVRSIYPDPV